ncbi:MAG: methyltransferase domain-containing protein [Candidatus Liptonbacteria bacterium]|nr:methyltransferase domain-containing protein [Candidatus Liptonbacteria bacterium]
MEDLQKTIEHERDSWNNIFENKLNKRNKSRSNFSSFWDEDYYKKITSFVESLFNKYKYSSLLEAGSGSGRSSILLRGNIDRTLLDISPAALEYAKHIAQKFKVKDVKFVIGNIFEIPFQKETFDFVWNTGVIEHYKPSAIKMILEEMMRVTKSDGIITFGVPNFYSGPTIKAWVLKFFPGPISGYRLGTEHFYKNRILADLVINAAEGSGKNIEWLKIEYFGSPLPLESPRWMIKTIGRIIDILLPKNRFMIMFFCKFKRREIIE